MACSRPHKEPLINPVAKIETPLPRFLNSISLLIEKKIEKNGGMVMDNSQSFNLKQHKELINKVYSTIKMSNWWVFLS